MIEMIIIDDETIIRESLNRFIDWESIDVHVCDTAANGVAAMASILNHKPDIILTDIRMPGLDGLELIRLLKEQNLSAEVIFISAYTNFEYAQKAIRLGAFDYITKPIDEDAIFNTVNRCKQKIIEKRKRASIVSSYAEKKSDKELHLLTNALISNKCLTTEELNLLFGASYTNSYRSTVAVGFWCSQENESLFNIELLSDILKKRLILPYTLFSPFPDFYLLICFSESEDLWNLYHCVLSAVSTDFFQKNELLITLSSPHIWEQNLTILYTELALTYAINHTKHATGIHSFSEISFITPSEISKKNFIEISFSGPLKHKEIEPLLLQFLSFFIKDNSIYDLGYIKLEFIRLIDFWIENLRKYCLHEYLQQEVLSVQKTISSQHYMHQVYETVYHLFYNIIDSVNQSDAVSSKHLVRSSIAYIHEHFSESFTLTDLASHLYISPAYLSKIFSEEMGEPFSKYLLKYRIQKAIEYMKNPEYKLYTIASLCGFSDITYFSKVFKSITGMSPQKYRNTLL